jgi:hypothetical protein
MSRAEMSRPDVGASPAARPAVVRFGVAILIGVAIGALTSVGQAHLDLPWSALVNSASPWLFGAFVAGALQLRRSLGIGAGVAVCVVEVVLYYVVTEARGYAASNAEIVFWIACAVVGGPIFGWAGWAWRRGSDRIAPAGAALICATFLAEGVGSYGLRLHENSATALYLVIGATLAVVVGASSAAVRRRPVVFVGATAAAFVLGLLVYWPMLAAAAGAQFRG